MRVLHIEDRRAMAEQIRSERNRVRFARLCREYRTVGAPVFIDAVDRVKLAFASPEFMISEIEWLTKYEERT